MTSQKQQLFATFTPSNRRNEAQQAKTKLESFLEETATSLEIQNYEKKSLGRNFSRLLQDKRKSVEDAQ